MKFIPFVLFLLCVAYAFGYRTGWRVVAFAKTKWTAIKAWFDSLSIVKFFRR